MANRISFTKKVLDKLPLPPVGKRVDYFDTTTNHLTLRVSHVGTKAFVLYRKIDGIAERITLGRYPAMSIIQARRMVAQHNGSIAVGNNPAEDKRSLRQESTLGEVFKRYMVEYAKPHKKSWEIDEQRYNVHLVHWQNKKLSAIKKQHVQKLLVYIADHQRMIEGIDKAGRRKVKKVGGKGASNQILRLLRKVFNLAIDWGWDGDNPCSRIKEYKSQSRDRFLEGDELPKFFEALSEEPNTTARDYILASLLTGARRENVLSMRWDQVNLERGEWFIPETKNGESQRVPLISAMHDLLKDRKAECGDGEWVFPSHGATGHLTNPDKAWKRILSRAGIDDLRGTWLHDLRRSMGSWQANTGASLSVIGKSLNHKNINTTAIYARLAMDPVRESMEKAAGAMFEAGGIKKDNVVNMEAVK
jgi:integrase